MSASFLRRFALATALALAAAGCVPVPGPNVYGPGQAARVQSVEFGVVESVRDVRIAGFRTGAGSVSGAMVGSIAGSYAGGSWNANVVGSIIGAILGGVIGGAMEEGATQRQGAEITVRLDSGALVAIVQDIEEPRFKPGDRVRVLSDGAMSRVTR